MGKSGVTGLRRVWNAMFYSMAGIRAGLRHEAAFRQECLLAVILIPLAFWFAHTPVERSLLVGTVVLVLIVELLNSAVEAVVDRVGTGQHELSGRAKDLGSAAVMLSLGLLIYVWVEILLKPF
jgi:diacylglycerol kinase (ATP)